MGKFGHMYPIGFVWPQIPHWVRLAIDTPLGSFGHIYPIGYLWPYIPHWVRLMHKVFFRSFKMLTFLTLVQKKDILQFVVGSMDVLIILLQYLNRITVQQVLSYIQETNNSSETVKVTISFNRPSFQLCRILCNWTIWRF